MDALPSHIRPAAERFWKEVGNEGARAFLAAYLAPTRKPGAIGKRRERGAMLDRMADLLLADPGAKLSTVAGQAMAAMPDAAVRPESQRRWLLKEFPRQRDALLRRARERKAERERATQARAAPRSSGGGGRAAAYLGAAGDPLTMDTRSVGARLAVAGIEPAVGSLEWHKRQNPLLAISDQFRWELDDRAKRLGYRDWNDQMARERAMEPYETADRELARLRRLGLL